MSKMNTRFWRLYALTTVVVLVCLTSYQQANSAPTRVLDPRLIPLPNEPTKSSRPFDQSIINESRQLPGYTATSASSNPPPPPSPGLQIARNTWDLQHTQSMGHQVGRDPGADIVHFTWTAWDIIPLQENDGRFVSYAAYSISNDSVYTGPYGMFLTDADERGGYANIAIGQGNRAHVVGHGREFDIGPYRPLHFYFYFLGGAPIETPLLGTENFCPEVLWSRVAVSQNISDTDFVHVIAHDGNNCPRDLIWYWRYNGIIWEGPVIIDSNFARSYVLAEYNNSDQCAIVINTENPFSDNSDIAYYESQTEGAGWLDGSELGPLFRTLVTNYNVPGGPQAWPDMTGGYDNSGVLHVAWIEQLEANATESVALRHWNNSRATIRTVTSGDWPSPATAGAVDLNLAKVSLGVGDGSTFCQGGIENNSNYLYLLYTQYGGPSAQEQADSSLEGLYNGELYLSSSRDGGASWSVPQNLTNTKTPRCNPGPGAPGANGQPPRPDSVCRSEAWPSIGLAVSDIDIFYVSDLDAGGIPYGEGHWQKNPMMYLRLPGGTVDAQHLCPTLAPRLASSLDSAAHPTGFQAYPSEMDSSILHLANIGNAALSGNVSVIYTNPASPSAPWLTLDGVTSPSPFSIPEGSPDSELKARMDAAGISVGTYEAEIRVAHNDLAQSTPVIYPVVFTVNACPCSCHTDPVCEGTTNILDVVEVIYVAFRAYASTTDPPCSRERTDVDCSGATDVLDVVRMVDVAFRAANASTEFCHPCL